MLDKHLAFIKVDPAGNQIQRGTRDADDDPDEAWAQLQASIEAEGNVGIRFDSPDDFPPEGYVWEPIKGWSAPPPEVDPHAALRAKAELVATGAAAFTQAERDKIDALKLLGQI